MSTGESWKEDSNTPTTTPEETWTDRPQSQLRSCQVLLNLKQFLPQSRPSFALPEVQGTIYGTSIWSECNPISPFHTCSLILMLSGFLSKYLHQRVVPNSQRSSRWCTSASVYMDGLLHPHHISHSNNLQDLHNLRVHLMIAACANARMWINSWSSIQQSVMGSY